jgi:hypothetical protein
MVGRLRSTTPSLSRSPATRKTSQNLKTSFSRLITIGRWQFGDVGLRCLCQWARCTNSPRLSGTQLPNPFMTGSDRTGSPLSMVISEHQCAIPAVGGGQQFETTLTVKSDPFERGPDTHSGILRVRRQQVDNSLGAVIEKALISYGSPIKGDVKTHFCQETFFRRPQAARILLGIQPPLRGSRRDVDRRGPRNSSKTSDSNPPVVSCSWVLVLTPFVSQDWQAWRLPSWQPWSYRRLVAYSFLGLSEGA